MAERAIKSDEFFSFVEGKSDTLCRVKHCRNRRAPNRRICYKCHMRLWRARNPTRDAYNNLRNKARIRKIKFTLTFDEFKGLSDAAGYVLNKGQTPDSLSIDRIDPDRGYEIDNVAVVTLAHNSSKGSYERWVTTADGSRVRLYQIEVGTEEQAAEEAYEEGDTWEPPYWLEYKEHIPTDNEPF